MMLDTVCPHCAEDLDMDALSWRAGRTSPHGVEDGVAWSTVSEYARCPFCKGTIRRYDLVGVPA